MIRPIGAAPGVSSDESFPIDGTRLPSPFAENAYTTLPHSDQAFKPSPAAKIASPALRKMSALPRSLYE